MCTHNAQCVPGIYQPPFGQQESPALAVTTNSLFWGKRLLLGSRDTHSLYCDGDLHIGWVRWCSCQQGGSCRLLGPGSSAGPIFRIFRTDG